MGSTSTNLKLPYPGGTDLVRDGDNAMQALAERIETRMPWGWIASAQTTSNETIPASTAKVVNGLSVTFTAPAIRRRIMVNLHLAAYTPSVAGTPFLCYIRLNTITIQYAGIVYATPGVTQTLTQFAYFDTTASQVCTVDAFAYNYAQPTVLAASANNPGTLLVQDIGPTTLT